MDSSITTPAGSAGPPGRAAERNPGRPLSPSGRAGRVVADRYRLVDEIGRGGMGVVWSAWDEVLHRDVAVKEVHRPAGHSEAEALVANERTMREARAAGKLANPHVVTVYDVVVEAGRPWIVMELLHARSLAEVLKAEGRLSPQRVARIGLQVLAALDEAHRHGMLHRDVKPGNVMLSSDDWVTLTDFGLATSSGDPHLTGTGLLVGSPAYMAPERARGEAELGPASDLWSLGVTLYAAVEGRSPFERADPMATLSAVLTADPGGTRYAGPLEGVLIGLLHKDPSRRYDTATTRALLEHTAAVPEETAAMRRTRRETERSSGDDHPGPDGSTEPGVDARSTASRAGTVATPAALPATTPATTVVSAAGRTAGVAANPRGDLRRGPARRGRLRTVIAGVLVLAVAAVVGYAVTLDDDAADGGGSPSSSGSGSGSGSGSLQEERQAAPDGYDWYQHASEYQVAVPTGWVRKGTGTRTDFVDPAGGAFLRIEYGPANPDGALAAWETAEEAWSASTPGYELIRLEPVDYRGWDAAEWEWTDSNDGRDRHVVNRTFVVGDVGYAIMLDTVPEKWAATEDVFTTAVETFTPPP